MECHSLTEPADVSSWGDDDSTTLPVVVVAVDDVTATVDVVAVVVFLFSMLKEEEGDEEVSMEGASTWADWLMAVVASFVFLPRKKRHRLGQGVDDLCWLIMGGVLYTRK